MTAPVWTRNEIESPCVQICVVDRKSRLCLGCYRSLDEIRDWSGMTPDAPHLSLFHANLPKIGRVILPNLDKIRPNKAQNQQWPHSICPNWTNSHILLVIQ